MKAEGAAIFDRTIQENPKVIGEPKALVETMGVPVDIREKMSPGR